MKRIIFIFLILIMFNIGFIINTNATEEEYENTYTESGSVVKYTGSDIPVEIPVNYYQKETEFRGCWVSFYAGDIDDYDNETQMKRQLTEILDTMQEYNLNSLVFHIRTHNDAYYKTSIAPINNSVSGCDFDKWDYLEWLIDECHARGIDFHAWLNPYRITSTETTKEYIKAKYNNFPNNPAHDLNNVLMSDDGAILDPGIPEVREYIIKVCMEIIKNYDVDAIHFDDYFYISNVDDSATRAKYNTSKLSIADFRRKQVDIFIDELHLQMEKYNKANNRAVELGISPSGEYQNGSYVSLSRYKYDANGNLTYPLYSATSGYSHYDSPLFSDTKKWIDNDWIDYIIPQVYTSFAGRYTNFASITSWWNAVLKYKKCKLYLGMGAYMMGGTTYYGWSFNENELGQQLRYAQTLDAVDGICIYQYKTLLKYKDTKNIQTLKEYWSNPAIVPSNERFVDSFDTNLEITNLKIHKGTNNTYALTFDRNDNITKYAIYKEVNSIKTLIGITGNKKDLDYVCFYDNSTTLENASYYVYPLNKVNKPCVISKTNTSEFCPFNKEIGSLEISVGTTNKVGGSYNLSFNNPIINIGTYGKYKITIAYDEDFNKIKYQSDYIEFSSTGNNIIRYSQNEKGWCEYIKVEVVNEFGSFTSEIKMSYVKDNVNSALDSILDFIDDFFDDLLG